MAVAVVIGTVIGSGVFKKPQVVAENVPYFGLAALVWVLGGVLALLGGLSLAEVAVRYPRAGGNYIYLREGFGPLWGFLWGWVDFGIVKSASIAALATVFADSLVEVVTNPAVTARLSADFEATLAGPWPRVGLTAAVILLLSLINVIGVRWGGGLQLAVTLVKVGSLLGILVLPFIAWALAPEGIAPATPSLANLSPYLPSGWDQFHPSRLGTAMLGVLWAYHGWMNIAPVAEEVRRPERNIPVALLGGIGIIIALYLGANAAYSLVLPAKEMAALKDTTVARVFSLKLLGPLGGAVASAAVMTSVFGALNGNLLAGPRVLYALSEDGLAPGFAGKVHERFRTPAVAILALGLLSTALVLVGAVLTRVRLPALTLAGQRLDFNLPEGKPLFDILTDFAMFGAICFETLAVATIFVLRRRPAGTQSAYRCPGFPVVPIIYVAIMSLVLANMFHSQRTEALTGLCYMACGAGVYAWMRGRKTRVTGR
jgi:amino acid transporter